MTMRFRDSMTIRYVFLTVNSLKSRNLNLLVVIKSSHVCEDMILSCSRSTLIHMKCTVQACAKYVAKLAI